MPRKKSADDVLSPRRLNRAALARQLLLERATMPVLEAIERVMGLQAQLPNPPYVGLWTRLAGFQLDDLTRLIERKRVVRSTMMRATQHLVTARDYLQLRPVLQPMLDRACRGNFGRQTAGVNLDELLDAARDLVGEQPRTVTELRALLGERWPKHDARALAYSVQYLLPLVHVPPGGTWGRGGAVPAVMAESWLRRPLSSDRSPEELILRYLGAFGPATVSDVQSWSGLTGLRPHVHALRSRLEVLRDESGNELFELPGAPRPDAETPAPVRFLPEYDNLIVAYADRTRVISDENRKRISAPNGLLATVLVNGVVAGRWKIARERGSALLEIAPFTRISKKDRAELVEEGMRLLAFTDEGSMHDLRFLPPD
jgi:hypothetical protein